MKVTRYPHTKTSRRLQLHLMCMSNWTTLPSFSRNQCTSFTTQNTTNIMYYSVFPSKIQGMTGGHDLGMAAAKSKRLDFPNSHIKGKSILNTSGRKLFWICKTYNFIEKNFMDYNDYSAGVFPRFCTSPWNHRVFATYNMYSTTLYLRVSCTNSSIYMANFITHGVKRLQVQPDF